MMDDDGFPKPRRTRVLRALGSLLLGLGTSAAAGAGALPSVEWSFAAPDYPWAMPQDHWAHRAYRIEWWYLTGHLEADGERERRFGYQLTLFRIGLSPEPPALDSAWSTANLLMGHAAVTDKDRGEHRFSDLLQRETPLLAGFGTWPDRRIAWSRAPAGTDGDWTIAWNGEAFDLSMADGAKGIAFELTTRPVKPLVFQGPGGLSRKADEPGAASLYYSFTRLQTRGTLRIGGVSFSVSGESWMDHEFSTSHLGEDQAGWDWFSLQLDGGREVMLYVMRRHDGTLDHASGTLVGVEGTAHYLGTCDFTVRATEKWKSPESGIVYPAGWILDIPAHSLNLTVAPDVASQENRSRSPAGLFYWEGAVTVRGPEGVPVGRGYVELTGYGGKRPPI